MLGMFIFVLPVMLGVIVGLVAEHKGHRFGPWMLFGALLFIVALPAVLLADTNAKAGVSRQCPACAEIVKAGASRCKHCGSALTPASSFQPDPTGRHQWRLWDGQRWADQVSDNGKPGCDPLDRTAGV